MDAHEFQHLIDYITAAKTLHGLPRRVSRERPWRSWTLYLTKIKHNITQMQAIIIPSTVKLTHMPNGKEGNVLQWDIHT